MPIIITRLGTAYFSGQSELEELEAKIGTTHFALGESTYMCNPGHRSQSVWLDG